MKFPWITAHSGSMGTPDNTLMSIKIGLQLGADFIEEDIRTTRDGVPVLAHDDVIKTKNHGICSVSKLTYSELKDVDIISNPKVGLNTHRIVRLKEMMELIRKSGKKANLDLKEMDVIDPIAHLIKKEGMTDYIILSGCEREKATYIQKHVPEFKRLLNVEDSMLIDSNSSMAIKEEIEYAHETGCSGLNVNYMHCNDLLLEQANANNIDVMVWTVNKLEDMKRFVEMGVHSVTTRNLEELMKLKKEMLS